MTTRVQRWGNSLAVRIPKALAVEAELEENADVDITARDGRLIVRATPGKRRRLDALLARVRPGCVHGETDPGRPRGREAW